MKLLIFILCSLLFSNIEVFSEQQSKFIAELPSPSEYCLFANGGWDGNWYVGVDHGWISKLPPIEHSAFKKCYLGAKLGRAKTLKQIQKANSDKSEKQELFEGPYFIYIGVSNNKDKKPKKFKTIDVSHIPLEGSLTEALTDIGEAVWFWVEIDKDDLNISDDNYIHLWTDAKGLSSAASSPILAAGYGSDKLENSYLLRSTKDFSDIMVIKYFEPALAVKLVKETAAFPTISIMDFKAHAILKNKTILEPKVLGQNITQVGLEIKSGKTWKPFGESVRTAPYDLIFDFSGLSRGKYAVRCWAENWFENRSYSNKISFIIEEEKAKEKTLKKL